MEFNFDSEDNVKAIKTPAIKVLNGDAKLWICDDNVQLCRWREDNKNLIYHSLKTVEEDTISGKIILNPRILILQRSRLLKVEINTERIVKVWARDDKNEIHYCVRKYMILFVDENNNPLHEIPVQLTAKGCFQFEFDTKVCEFRTEMTKLCNEKATRMNDAWYSMCVFVPTFKSMMRGEGNKQRKACITTTYESPTKDNWLSLCVGRRDDPANKFWVDAEGTYTQHVYKLYSDTLNACDVKGW